MRYFPKEDYDLQELKKLKAEGWMIEALKKNPDYCSWGNYEDYMSKKDGWDGALEFESITDGLWTLDELNEIVNFYFELTRKSESCTYCDGSGLNPETKKLSDDWYSFDKTEWVYTSSNRRYNNLAWSNHLTEIEIEALVKAGRLSDVMEISCHYDEDNNKWMGWVNGVKQEIEKPEIPSPEKVNEWNRTSFGHDSINHWIAVKARAKYLGVYGHCEHCEGKGSIFIETKAKLGLQLWMLHPRKGCSRGAYIKDIKQEDMPKVIEHLKQAAQRNADRFSKL